ncbi:MAG: Crp/Fnr family transcriptional regulator [Desulfococcaceae bacterium]
MDEDGIPENGIQISPSVHLAAQGRDVDFSLYGNTFGASPDVAALLAAAGENGAFSAGPGPRAPVSEESAAAHPAKTLPALTPSVPHPGSGDGRGGSGGRIEWVGRIERRRPWGRGRQIPPVRRNDFQRRRTLPPPNPQSNKGDLLMDGNILERFEFFEGLQPADRDAIAGMSEIREYPPDTLLFRGGDPADAVYGLLEGTVELSLMFRDRILKTDEVHYEEAIRARFEERERPIIVDEIHPGEIFGWSALSGLEARTAAARSIGAVQAFAIPAAELRKRFADNPTLGLTLMERLNRVIAARLRERTERMVEAWTEAFGAKRI